MTTYESAVHVQAHVERDSGLTQQGPEIRRVSAYSRPMRLRPAKAEPSASTNVSTLEQRFEGMCTEVRNKALSITRNVRQLACHLQEMKIIHEALTGTGWGKRRKNDSILSFDEEVAARTGVERSLIRRYCRIAQLDARTNDRVDEKPEIAGNLTLLYKLAQVNEDSRHQALDAYERDGRRSMDAVMRNALPAKPKSALHKAPVPNAAIPPALETTTTEFPAREEAGGSPENMSIRQDNEQRAAPPALGVTCRFESPPDDTWVERELPDGSTLRLNVQLGGGTISTVTVTIVAGPRSSALE